MGFEEPNHYSHSTAHYQRMLTKAIQTLIGICAGLVADGELNDHEIKFLRLWLEENHELEICWPGNIIATRIRAAMQDGVISDAERKDLLTALKDLTGTNFLETGSATPDCPALPIDKEPKIVFEERLFCFTGKFLYGTRDTCEKTSHRLGAGTADNVINALDYLVIGSLIQGAWIYQSHGRKIEKAMKLRQKGDTPIIISEEQWVAALDQYL